MSLPDLLKHVYNQGTEDVIRRGRKIFHTAGVSILEYDTLTEHVEFRVRNDAYQNFYKVIVQNYVNTKKLVVRCQCPYNMGTICRHEVAALFQLNDLLQSGFFDNVQLTYNQSHTNIRMRQITHHYIKLFSSKDIFYEAEDLVKKKHVRLLSAENDTVKAVVQISKAEQFEVVLIQNDERYFDTSCSCDETRFPICIHKAAVFIHVLNNHGSHYFSTLRNWDTQKNKLLNAYGFTLEDDLTGKFEFAYHEGKPFLRLLDPALKKIEQYTNSPSAAATTVVDKIYSKKLGALLLINAKLFPFLDFDLVAGDIDDRHQVYRGNVETVNINQFLTANHLNDQEKLLVTTIRRISKDELIKALKRNSPFGDFWDNFEKDLETIPTDELYQQVWEFYLPRYQKFLEQFSEYPYMYIKDANDALALKYIHQVRFSEQKFTVALYVSPVKSGKSFSIQPRVILGEASYALTQVHFYNHGLLKIDDVLYCATDMNAINMIYKFGNENEIVVAAKDWTTYLEETLLPLSTQTNIHFDASLQKEVVEAEPTLKLYINEHEKLMSFKPIFVYNGVEKQWLDTTTAISASDGKVLIYHRNEPAEQTFLTMLRHLHTNMQESRKARAFTLPISDMLKGGWYFDFLEKLKDLNVHVEGNEDLKEVKINIHKPITQIHFTSGIDWFETELDVAFGDQHVTVADIKKALAKNETHVKLKDGTIGLFTEEWMDKYALMVKMGSVSGNGIRLNKMHFGALENIAEAVPELDWYYELREKKERLLNYDFDHADVLQAPDNLNAELRPYQLDGFRWLSFLADTGWGGILADDMGLGKTLQTLSYLQYYYNNNNKAKFLVACPTTLIYNWENEIKKFTSDMTYHIYHGPNRKKVVKDIQDKTITIVTYGTLRSDIKMFSNIEFDFIVLDESQAIKNPMSQIAKASLELNAKHRLALSGTPLQNNTFDLFAQMNFLNPGLLGSMEFFRNEFATPIDKMQDKDAKTQLKKLIFPFLLRRTKEQVAPDLPLKTEIVHLCEMGTKQRKIYDAYRNSFRTQILGEIEEKGIERSQISILTGLMKLRQICDTPAILNEEEKYENHSVKIEELTRELTENTGQHKALVFSQFLGMLHYIRLELEKQNIPYVYFDGSTSSADREKAIQKFQEEDDCRVFLISLKAGGVGLNLTAADYVYIVDPWWNPAVEQQAIDRTHRIGQTKNIFAYRMICKDTIEEKILELQERKLVLVKDLIGDDSGFLKKLTKEDIEYLLS